jgi:hypothetical protein
MRRGRRITVSPFTGWGNDKAMWRVSPPPTPPHNVADLTEFVGLELGLPVSAELVQTSGLNSETFPAWSILRIEFPVRGDLPPVTLHWYDGGKKPSSDLIGGHQLDGNGAILVGERGTLYSVGWTGGDWHLLPEDKFRDWKPPAATVPRSAGHHKEWLAACKGGPASFCNFIDFAAPLTEVMLLGCLAQLAAFLRVQRLLPSIGVDRLAASSCGRWGARGSGSSGEVCG